MRRALETFEPVVIEARWSWFDVDLVVTCSPIEMRLIPQDLVGAERDGAAAAANQVHIQ